MQQQLDFKNFEVVTTTKKLPDIPLIENKNIKAEVKITGELYDKIRFICSNPFTSSKEWSGVLFYTVEGDITSNVKFIAKDLLVMDIGNSASTAFAYNSDIAAYMCENDLMGCYLGLIHSHVNFGVFFSGVDKNTLISEGLDTNHFLSLIVNNAGDAIARFTIHSTMESQNIVKFKSYNNEEKTYNSVSTTEVLEYVECKVNSYKNDILQKRLQELSTKKVPTLGSYESYGYTNLKDNSPIYKKPEVPVQTPFPNIPITKSNFDLKAIEKTYSQFTISQSLLDNVVKQLVTGSVLSPLSTNLDIKKFVNNMNSTFSKRFPQFKDYTNFIDTLVDYILFSSDIKDKDIIFTGVTEYDMQELDTESLIAYKLYATLDKLPSNKYIEYIKEVLLNYV